MNRRDDEQEWRRADSAAAGYGEWCDEAIRKAQSCMGTGENDYAEGHRRRADYWNQQEQKEVHQMGAVNDYISQRKRESLSYRLGCPWATALILISFGSVIEVIRAVIPMLFRRKR